MLAKRVIPCLDVKDGRVVKGVNFVGLRDAGDPVEVAARYDRDEADELTFLDITASHEARPILLDRPWVLTEDSFDRTIGETDVPILVDFYADWCGPCKMMAPHVDQLAAAKTGKALVAKLNTDLAQATSQRFNVRGIPTTIVFRDGKEANRITGAVKFAELERLLGAS